MTTADEQPTPPDTAKRCGKCGVVKPLAEFSLRRDRPCGRRSHCLQCDRAKAKRYYDAQKNAGEGCAS